MPSYLSLCLTQSNNLKSPERQTVRRNEGKEEGRKKGRKERRREGGWKTVKFLAMVGRSGYVLRDLRKRD